MHCVQVAQQIRAAQQKAALQGQAPPAWAIGARCQALNPLDATWQEATVKGISATGNFVLAFTGREDELEEVLPLSPQKILDDVGAASPFISMPYLQVPISSFVVVFGLSWPRQKTSGYQRRWCTMQPDVQGGVQMLGRRAKVLDACRWTRTA